MSKKIVGNIATGYKGFNLIDGKLNCRGFEFEIGKEYEIKGELILCKNGFHFCFNLNNVYDFYNFNNSVVGEIQILGEIKNEIDMSKSVTNKFKIIKIFTKEELLKLSNIGDSNTGYLNTGNRNTGDSNTGDSNTGYRNTGDSNTGNSNTGNRNTGNRNTGYLNTGNRNTGNRNTGDWNTGDWNTGDWNTGYFNTKQNNIHIFDKITNMTHEQFVNTEEYNLLIKYPFILTEWIYYSEEEKEKDIAKKYIGGYLKKYTYKDACEKWWNNYSNDEKQKFKKIPNFNKEKFKEITGIDIDKRLD